MALVTELARNAERRVALDGVPLRCWDARRLVSDYLDGELATADAEGVEAHLATCPTCPPLYAGLVEARAGLTVLRDPDSVIDPRTAERLRRHLGVACADPPARLMAGSLCSRGARTCDKGVRAEQYDKLRPRRRRSWNRTRGESGALSTPRVEASRIES